MTFTLFLCKECRLTNMNKLENESKMNELKSKMIRRELVNKPLLTLDLLCGLPTVKALEKLIEDILKVEPVGRSKYILFLIDVDNLKALNSALGHKGADGVIKGVGNILNKYTKQVNDGQWRDDKDGLSSFYKAWCFRFVNDKYPVLIV